MFTWNGVQVSWIHKRIFLMGFLEALSTLGSLVKGFYKRNICLDILKDLSNSCLVFQMKMLYLQGLMYCKKFVICFFRCRKQANPLMHEFYNLSSKESMLHEHLKYLENFKSIWIGHVDFSNNN